MKDDILVSSMTELEFRGLSTESETIIWWLQWMIELNTKNTSNLTFTTSYFFYVITLINSHKTVLWLIITNQNQPASFNLDWKHSHSCTINMPFKTSSRLICCINITTFTQPCILGPYQTSFFILISLLLGTDNLYLLKCCYHINNRVKPS